MQVISIWIFHNLIPVLRTKLCIDCTPVWNKLPMNYVIKIPPGILYYFRDEPFFNDEIDGNRATVFRRQVCGNGPIFPHMWQFSWQMSSFSNLSRHFNYVTTHSPTLPSLYLRHSSFSNPSVASPASKFILQPFFRFSYVTNFSLSHLANRPCPGCA